MRATLQKPYDFAASVCDHGWPMLAPFVWDNENKLLQRVERLGSARIILLQIGAEDAGETIVIQASANIDDLSDAETQEVDAKLRWMLKLDE